MYQAVRKSIHYHSDSAASIQTVTGWVSRDGHFWGQDEHMARWSGCTHKTCECGRVVSKGWVKCEDCREASRIERFRSLPERHTGGGMVYSDSHQRYFDDLSDAADYAAEEGVRIASLDLVCCKPTYMGGIYPDEIFEGDMPEDQCFADIAPKELLENRCDVIVDFIFENMDDPDDTRTIRWAGADTDNGGKGFAKAGTNALKEMLKKTFLITDREDAKEETEVIEHQTDEGMNRAKVEAAKEQARQTQQRWAASLKSSIETCPDVKTLKQIKRENSEGLADLPTVTRAFFEDLFAERERVLGEAD